MCTAVSDYGSCHLFGRTLDLECSYGERVVITPRNFRFDFLREQPCLSHPGIVGVACVQNNTPLYYDGINESGLGMAGLNFPVSAVYHPPKEGMHNIASFELIPWVLSQCRDVSSAVELLRRTNVIPHSFSPQLPASPLHWIIADKSGAVTVESVSSGLEIYENPFGVLTNEPPFPYHVTRITDFMHLDSAPSENNLCPRIRLEHYSGGSGALGLPGDLSSESRFVRAVFAKNHTVYGWERDEELKENSRVEPGKGFDDSTDENSDKSLNGGSAEGFAVSSDRGFHGSTAGDSDRGFPGSSAGDSDRGFPGNPVGGSHGDSDRVSAGVSAELKEVSRFFHLMDTVAQPCGFVKTNEGKNVLTVYTSCANADTSTYYFTTYNCRRIRAVRLADARLDSDTLVSFPLSDREDVLYLSHGNV